MGDKNIKTIRKQLRNIAQEMAPAILTNEVQQKGLEIVRKEIAARLDTIEQGVRDTLAQLDARQKDMQSFIMRTLASMQPASTPIENAPPVGAPTPTENAAALPHRE